MALLTYSSPHVYKPALASMLLVLSVLLIGHDKLSTEAKEMIAHRNENLTIGSGVDVHVTGDGGYIRVWGYGAILIDESPQILSQHGTGAITTNGMVEEGLSQHGSGAITINGIVKRGIVLAGPGDITVNGDVYGPIRRTGSGALRITGHHYP